MLSPLQAEWFFRGTPNAWVATQMQQVNATTYTIEATFAGQGTPARFKIDRHGNWTEAYPAQDYQVADNKTYLITFHTDTKQIDIVERNPNKWFFRGTPNDWNTREMTLVSANTYQTTVTFAGEETPARFLIDHYGDFSERYPAQDYAVPNDFKTYEITFNSVTKAITLNAIDTWFFRGTSNDWNTAVMTKTGANTYEHIASFAGEETPARFVIDHHGDFSDSYPILDDYEVDDYTQYKITFNSTTKAIGVEELAPVEQWYFRGTPNNWNMAPMTKVGTDQWQYIAEFHGEGTPARFLIDSIRGFFTERYPANNDFTVTDNKRYRILFNSATKAITATPIGNSDPNWDFREESIYFLLTARFYDGDSANNARTEGDDAANNPVGDPSWRGDFKGLVEKLDYIKAMGFSAIWITPVVENQSFYDYHGYHAKDFYQEDPRLESPNYGLQRLIDEMHARDMKLIVDIVVNHSGTWGAEGLLTQTSSVWATRMQNLFASPYYHDGWLMNWEDYTCQIGTIHGDLPDFNTEDATVQNYLIGAYNRMIDMGVDAFRVDTAKHVSRSMFNKRFIPAWKARGGDKFFMFAEVATRVHEVWNKGVAPLSTPFYTWKERQNYTGTDTQIAQDSYNYEASQGTGNQPTSNNHLLNGNTYHAPNYANASGMSVIDFPMHWNFTNAWSAFGKRFDDIYYNDATWNVVYVDSHDYGPNTDNRYDGSEGDSAENFTLMFTFRGIPCLYYGSEIQFKKGVRADLGASAPLENTGRAYYGSHIQGSVTTTNFGEWSGATGNLATTLNHPLAKHVQRLNRIRHAVPALQKGQYSTDNISGGLAFKRRYTSGATDSLALVTISGNATFNSIPNGTYVDAVTGTSINVTGGTLTATCTGQGNARIFILNGPGKIGDNGTYLKP
jgi:glycosidase